VASSEIETGLPADAESLIQDVADAVLKDIQFLLSILMPDGRPFGMVPMTEEEQIQQYLEQGLHDDVGAAEGWIRAKVGELRQLLESFGVTEEEMQYIHLYDIVEAAAIHWSAKMEAKLKKLGMLPVRFGGGVSDAASGYQG
jgi:hypothetical protein